MLAMHVVNRGSHSQPLSRFVAVLQRHVSAGRMVLQEHRRSFAAAQRYAQLRARRGPRIARAVFAEFYAD